LTDATPIAVTSRSFSRHPVLRAELLERYGDVRFNDEGISLRGEALVEFLRGRVKAITALEPIDDELLARLPELRLISKIGVGLDMVDRDALERHGVALSFATGTNSRSVAELVLCLALVALRHVVAGADEARDGGWTQRKGRTLSGRTVGIVGFGNVGREVARLLEPFDCTLVCTEPREDVEIPEPIACVSLDQLIERADVITLHVDLNESTRNLITEQRLALCKPDAILINTARGGLVDEDALKRALGEGLLGVAAFDVFESEPPADAELLALPNFIATPHIGGSTEEAILAMGRAAIAGLDAG
jgi:D-3-phosphoglycerate dehydrogenase